MTVDKVRGTGMLGQNPKINQSFMGMGWEAGCAAEGDVCWWMGLLLLLLSLLPALLSLKVSLI